MDRGRPPLTRIVVDASAIGRAVLPDERDQAARALLDMLESELVVPAHWPMEIANLVVKASRRQRLSATERRHAVVTALEFIAGATVESVAYPSTAIELAITHSLSAYDAAYVELALRTRLPLLTVDERMAAAAERAGIALVKLG